MAFFATKRLPRSLAQALGAVRSRMPTFGRPPPVAQHEALGVAEPGSWWE
jgi:hypothetical protein